MSAWIIKVSRHFVFFLSVFVSCDNRIEIEKTNEVSAFYGKKIGIIGDSISSFKDCSPSGYGEYKGASYKTYYPRGDVKKVSDMWWGMVAFSLGIGLDDITNCSWSGSTVTGEPNIPQNAFAACSSQRIDDLACRGYTPDIILCYISCNDWAWNREIGSWSVSDTLLAIDKVMTLREAYATMLSRLKVSYPKSRVICLTILEDGKRDSIPGPPSENDNGVSVAEWNTNIIQIAEAFGCEVIDLHSCGITYDSIDGYTIDGVHPNKAGMGLMSKAIVDYLMN